MPFKVTAYDAAGTLLPAAEVRVTGPMRSIRFADGKAAAFRADTFMAVAASVVAPGDKLVTLEIPVTIAPAPVGHLELLPGRAPSMPVPHSSIACRGFDAVGQRRPLDSITWRSSNPAVAKVDRFGNLTGLKSGS